MTATPETSPFVVSFDWLKDRIGQPDLKLVDASWYLPAQNRNGEAEYRTARIPGAVYFDLDRIVDPNSSLPHTLPDAETFARAAGDLGLKETDTIVVYDGPGMFSAPRVWWMLRIFGAGNTYVLDGGFDAWRHQGLPVETGDPAPPAPATFNASVNPAAVSSFEHMRAIVSDATAQIADARGPGRFTGTEPEPREGMRSGHMPGALNVPFVNLLDGGKLKPLSELRQVLESSGLDLDKPVVTSCGSGVTAAVITLALQSIGHRDNTLYDGSWSEWGGRDDTPIATGEA
ncbi:MAG: 3-mercaptopyruvate sulfurtransferase [Hoeflea sp.]|uniref:3-mercaptopyruvate sulfurtransferase n=1 Tax=Hoeflea sp. TaxID=1940281 RepID=UPI001DFB94D1|nr:3-mercaptopyruvate sulfurtransferase [Hoeflea sp.]MBU4529735.1 3-mercaptopyruvate sulfurtransferase [Alphaproteobacteria bacterium]MBU4543296.1 3-mercaptopyruvate sulfurtransferase [Alphaproteobacteria bacterium]MBU4552483.1 3-mercaptopyruvate sulfurtransferase [Alphaproteobacteria bacterium]MBV1723499.1 3-mercaptopyruvate sulfurtransferase [Hoeflea sp.]MBV1762948.1 3-mercaptopyruvate sulfurtransferase [Hoeflea sp.]